MPFEHDPGDTCPFAFASEYNAAMADVYGAIYEPVSNERFLHLREQASCPVSMSASDLPTPIEREQRAEEIREEVRATQRRVPDSGVERRVRRRELAEAGQGPGPATAAASTAATAYPAAPSAARTGAGSVALLLGAGIAGLALVYMLARD